MNNLSRKKRILYLSAVIPDTTSGGRLAMYRHYIERPDFDVMIASANQATEAKIQYFKIQAAYPVERLRKTRFVRLANNISYLWNWFVLPYDLLREAKAFCPDLIFTVPDNWHCGLAWQLSRQLKVPLAVNFQDLFPLSYFLHSTEKPYPSIRHWLMSKFHFLNRHANLVFYTSEGMRDWFGCHPNGYVLYPLGHHKNIRGLSTLRLKAKPWKVVYAGNCYGAYGRMLLKLAYILKDSKEIKFQIYAAGNDWPSDVIEELQSAGIYMGFCPFDQLKGALEAADAFLTVMSFEKQEEPFVRTSFTTKWLDYAPYSKPVCVWAPEYSTAAKFALKHSCGPLVTDDNPQSVSDSLLVLFRENEQWADFASASFRVAETVLNPHQLHKLLFQQIYMLKRNNDLEALSRQS